MATLAARGHRAHYQAASEPNVIPFIDVLLVLLVIFMVTAPMPTTDLRLDLPRPGPALPAIIPPTIVDVRATSEGYALFVSGAPSSLDGLANQALSHVMSHNPALTANDVLLDARIHIRADLSVRYQDVITIAERLQDGRFQKVTVLAQRAE